MKQKKEIICGVYKITNTVNGKFYIGSAKDIKDRWRSHRSDLNRKVHHSKSLQEDWDIFGKDSFAFEIVETCEQEPRNIRIQLEQKYLDELKPWDKTIGYNTNRHANNGNETRGEDRHTSTISEKVAMLIIEDLKSLDNKYQDIADKYNVSINVVRSISLKTSWTYLTKEIEFPSRESNATYLRRYDRINDDDLNNIIEYLLDGKSNVEISKLTGIKTHKISEIRNHETYKEYTKDLVFPYVHDREKDHWITANVLSEEDVINIYNLHDLGVKHKEIAKKYNVHVYTIGCIVKGETWSYLFKKCGRESYIPKNKRRPVRCITTGMEYNSIFAASKDTHCSEKSIRLLCEGEDIITHNNYKFEYII